MKRLVASACCCAMILVCGCGPMQMPMPVRLEEESQKNIDKSWDDALTPVGRFDHAALLDAFLITQAYQVGVDRLTFHSEKKVAAGLVVMDIDYDRLKPDGDRFMVKLFDPAHNLLRQETYGRKEIEDAYEDLFIRRKELEDAAKAGGTTPEQLKELAQLKARQEAVEAVFPKEKKPAEEKPKAP